MAAVYATIILELSNDGMYIKCDDIEKTDYIKRNQEGNTNIQPLLDFINEVEDFTNPDVTYQITEKGKKLLEELSNKNNYLNL